MSLRQQKKRQAREDILAAARGLIDDVGFEASRMRDIAAAANVSYQTLYNYFPTKTQILQGILLQDVGNLADEMGSDSHRHQGDLLGALTRMTRLSIRVIDKDNRDLWRRATLDLLGDNPEVMGLFARINTKSHESLQLLLSRAQEFGELKHDAPIQLITDIVYALIDYMILRYLLDPSTTEDAVLNHLDAQVRLVVEPYLQPTH
jgi:AcrR family transcriptional regulator